MKAIHTLLIIIFLLSGFVSEPIPLRGIVEGFYGTPWTFENRADLIIFSGKHQLNSYIYAPKDDPYHRHKWREPYPSEKIDELEKLIDISRENGVKFIFAVSPGIDLNYTGIKAEEDFNFLMEKLNALYNVGCRDFAIFFDDIKVTQSAGKLHALFLNKLQKELDIRYRDVGPVITVPTDYYIEKMIQRNGTIKQYTYEFAHTLDKKVIVLYTGDRVVVDGISEESYQKALDIYNRDLGIWWNYPVNDFLPAKLALGPIEKLPTSKVQSIFYNPMGQVQLSKIALETGAEYALYPETYNAEDSWHRTMQKQFGKLADPMTLFATHSRHMQNNWANVGPADGPVFYYVAHNAVENKRLNLPNDYETLFKLINDMENAANKLLEELPSNILAECVLQLIQWKRIINADRIAARCLQGLDLKTQLKALREEIKAHEKEAILSEKSAILFIDEVLKLYE